MISNNSSFGMINRGDALCKGASSAVSRIEAALNALHRRWMKPKRDGFDRSLVSVMNGGGISREDVPKNIGTDGGMVR